LLKTAYNFNSDRNTAGVGLTSGGAVATGVGATAIAAGISKGRSAARASGAVSKEMSRSAKALLASGAVAGTAGLGTMIPGLVMAADTDKENAYEKKRRHLKKVAEDAYWDTMEKIAASIRLPSAVRNTMRKSGTRDSATITEGVSFAAAQNGFGVPSGMVRKGFKQVANKPAAVPAPAPVAGPTKPKPWSSWSTKTKVGVGFGAGALGATAIATPLAYSAGNSNNNRSF